VNTDDTFVPGYAIAGFSFIAFIGFVAYVAANSMMSKRKKDQIGDENLRRMVEEARRGGSQVADFDVDKPTNSR
jgi:uncharacterized membrane protein